MKNDEDVHVCPVALAGSLDNKLRRFIQNPQKIVGPYLKDGMTALDVGCGPGFFSIDLAYLVGSSGKVIAADLQEGMLEKIKAKIRGTELENRIILHKCQQDRIGVSGKVDFVLLVYMVHEVPDKQGLFNEIETILKPGGQVLIIEPPFHVSKKAFEKTVKIAREAGLAVVERPKLFLNKTVVLEKERNS
jgi:ubiquinone/menaquinone biosynthesis C-methylase UbiE